MLDKMAPDDRPWLFPDDLKSRPARPLYPRNRTRGRFRRAVVIKPRRTVGECLSKL